MVSAQILVGGDGAETVLEGGGLQLVDRRARTEIPLAVVQEARTGGGHHAEIVLTDGAVHSVDGGNPTAAAAFVTALTAALPERRETGRRRRPLRAPVPCSRTSSTDNARSASPQTGNHVPRLVDPGARQAPAQRFRPDSRSPEPCRARTAPAW
ncbi:hypothetical protein L1085_035695 [Streptomyces sp. MSC1_001]|jgi:hypothetical protein|uniref:hypothetical protein n=1 Tax=Streptomyces sp. MSC1_001 TaxID=2909263 RepID=UPI002030F015|nr:hypothetical protein [Streptomyces sp. MSC1_001]